MSDTGHNQCPGAPPNHNAPLPNVSAKRNGSAISWTLIALWALALVVPGGWEISSSPVVQIGLGLLVLWFLLNFYLWFSPRLRISVIERRGPLLGIGFAFAAALLSSVADGAFGGVRLGAGLFFWRFLLLSLPFVMPFIIKPSPYPHLLDLAVLGYALSLPHLPGFQSTWITLSSVSQAGFFEITSATPSGGAALGAGTLCAIGLIGTYYYAARSWSAAPLDFRVREKDLVHALRTAIYALIGWALGFGGAWIAGAQLEGGTLTIPTADVFGTNGLGDVLSHLVLAVGLATLFEAIVFRGVIQSGWPHWLPKAWSSNATGGVAWAGAMVAAVLHTTQGVYALSGAPAFGFALGLVLAYRGAQRLLPAASGQAMALLILALLGSVVP